MHDTDLVAIGLLQDPARRALYAYVVGQSRAVGRNEAAQAVGMQRTLAAFHLDRLARAGLLDVTYGRLNARSGPGAGRPAKLYQRPATERSVSLPPRDYGRAAAVLADAIERTGAEEALYESARVQGRAAGRSLLTDADLQAELAARSYEPYLAESGIRLRNCPFHGLAQEFPVLGCGMNLALLEGVLEGSGLQYRARLDPRGGECCVALDSKTNVD